MKKIGILTASRTNNFGTDLQAYAMQELFSRNACAELVDYRCPKLENSRRIFRGLSPKSLVMMPYHLYKSRVHDRFRRRHFRYSKGNYTAQTLQRLPYDAVVVGSDQIWNLDITGRDMGFFLPFEGEGIQKWSYAASLGKTDVTPWEEKHRLSRYLKEFSCVSVREQSGVEALERIGVHAQEDLDPILCVEPETWEAFSHKKKYRPYILLYQVGTDMAQNEPVLAYAREKGYKVLRICPWTYPVKGVQTRGMLGLERWMELVRNAQMVVTDSYHGLSFSIATGTNFRLTLMAKEERNSRSLCLLEKLQLQDFVLGASDMESQPQWDRVEQKLAALRASSREYIRRICEDQK